MGFEHTAPATASFPLGFGASDFHKPAAAALPVGTAIGQWKVGSGSYPGGWAAGSTTSGKVYISQAGNTGKTFSMGAGVIVSDSAPSESVAAAALYTSGVVADDYYIYALKFTNATDGLLPNQPYVVRVHFVRASVSSNDTNQGYSITANGKPVTSEIINNGSNGASVAPSNGVVISEFIAITAANGDLIISIQGYGVTGANACVCGIEIYNLQMTNTAPSQFADPVAGYYGTAPVEGGAYVELLPGGEFHGSDLGGWISANYGGGTSSDALQSDGTAGFTWTAGSANGQIVPATAHRQPSLTQGRYVFTARVKASNNSFTLGLNVTGAANPYPVYFVQSYVALTTSWQEVRVEFDLPAGMQANEAVYIGVNNAIGTVYIDHCSLRKIPFTRTAPAQFTPVV